MLAIESSFARVGYFSYPEMSVERDFLSGGDMFGSFGRHMVQIFFFVNPHIVLPLFLSMTQNYTSSERRTMGIKACIYALALGYGFAFGGGVLLDLLGVPVSLFRAGGGLLLGVTAWNLLYASPKKEGSSAEPTSTVRADLSLSPLAFPLITGPATLTGIVTVVQTAAARNGVFVGYSTVLLEFSIVIGILYLCLVCGDFILKLLGRNGCLILEKLGGIILIAMSATMIFGGLKAFFLAN